METKALIGIIMGSESDWPTLSPGALLLDEWGISYEKKVVSAHRTPHQMVKYASEAEARGIKVIIACAGGAAHLPGMVASITVLPVIGVPVQTKSLGGVDSLYSIAQMPAGIPVATMAIGGGLNAALFALRILALSDSEINSKLIEYQKSLEEKVAEMNRNLDLK